MTKSKHHIDPEHTDSTHHRHKKQKTTHSPSAPSSSSSLPPLPPIPTHLASQVFTHASVLNSHISTKSSKCYERLEFLGDAYIELFASKAIFPAFPSYPAGRLSQLRESLVKNETLAVYAVEYGFDKKVVMGGATRERFERDGRQREKILGDVFEAYVAAVVEADGEGQGGEGEGDGAKVAERWMRELWKGKLEGTKAETKAVDANAKVQLASAIGGRGVKVEYVDDKPVEIMKGKENYTVACYVEGWGIERVKVGIGQGLTKKEAGFAAASEALKAGKVQKMMGMKKVFDQAAKEKREKEGRESDMVLTAS